MANLPGYTSSLWDQRIHNANKQYGEWDALFKCSTLEQYYRGFQWKGKKDMITVNYNPYTLNLFYSTLKIKLANMIFQRPRFNISPTPGNSQWDLDFAVQSAQLKQDTLNALIIRKSMNFAKHLKRAARDSFFRFGIIEVGYAADFRNPQKEDPLLRSWNDDTVPDEKDRVIEKNDLPLAERMYIKRINPRRFRVSISDALDLNDHEWVGYYEFYYTRTLKNTKGIKWPDSAGDSSFLAADYSTGILADPSTKFARPEYLQLLSNGRVSKVWHIWDLVSKQELLLLDGCTEDPLWSDDFERLPLIDLRWDEDFEGFYPMPPAFQWCSPQDEINEAREQTRSYRRRFTRKFQFLKGSIEPEEAEKFASGPDGVLVEVKQADAITPIQNPEQGQTAENALLLAKDDFNIISGTSAEARGQSADRETATSARLVDMRAQIRESADQLDFTNFVNEVGREVLLQAQEKMELGLWVKYNANPSEQFLQDMQVNQPFYKFITSQDLSDGYDFSIDVDVENATPQAMEQAKQTFMTFVAFVQNFPMIATSPVLIREAAFRIGYRNEKVIHQMQQAAILQMMNTAVSQAGAAGVKTNELGIGQQGNGAQNPNNAAQTQIAQQASPDIEGIQQQITQQLQ